MLSNLHPVRDLRLSGHVIYTGKSSMEVAVKMEALEANGTEKTLMLGVRHHGLIITYVSSLDIPGRFSMVCRDANSHQARQVHPLIVSTPEERTLHQIGEGNSSLSCEFVANIESRFHL